MAQSKFLNSDDLSGWVQGPPEMISQAVADVLARARHVAPGLFGALWDGDAALVTSILRPAAVWLVSTRGGIVSQHTAGPFAETFRDRDSGLSDADVADLRALAGESGGQFAVARGHFPPGFDYDRIFPHPSLPWWQ